MDDNLLPPQCSQISYTDIKKEDHLIYFQNLHTNKSMYLPFNQESQNLSAMSYVIHRSNDFSYLTIRFFDIDECDMFHSYIDSGNDPIFVDIIANNNSILSAIGYILHPDLSIILTKNILHSCKFILTK
jgi:hypothetical protein